MAHNQKIIPSAAQERESRPAFLFPYVFMFSFFLVGLWFVLFPFIYDGVISYIRNLYVMNKDRLFHYFYNTLSARNSKSLS